MLLARNIALHQNWAHRRCNIIADNNRTFTDSPKKASTKGYINCGGLYSGIFRKISFMTCPEKVNVGKNNSFWVA
jgi:hypothetical protein